MVDIKSLRIVLTKKCNLECTYCNQEGVTAKENESISNEAIGCLIDTLKDKGLKSVKLTGGEPFLYDDIKDLLYKIGSEKLFTQITTNGFYLNDYIDDIVNSGIDELIVSLDTLKPAKFEAICRGKKEEHSVIIENIESAAKKHPNMWLNMVVDKDNIGEIHDMIDYCVEHKINLKIFELMSGYSDEKHTSKEDIIDKISEKAEFGESLNDDTRLVYHKEGTKIHFIQIYCNENKCEECLTNFNTVRVTPYMELKPCLRDEKRFKFEASRESIDKAIEELESYRGELIDNKK